MKNIFSKNSSKKLSSFKLSKRNHRSLWALCAVSFLWSMSSLMVFSVMPSFLTEELSLSHRRVGYMEGGALFLSFMAKVFSGVWSDYIRDRKSLIVLGSFLTVLSKPLFALAGGSTSAFFARFTDRFSKGLRSAPTDALLADIGSMADYGRVYGLRQSLYTAGAIVGAVFTIVFMHIWGPQYRVIFVLATIPAALGLIILYKGVSNSKDIENSAKKLLKKKEKKNWSFLDLQALPWAFWVLMLALSFLMLARFSEVFITLRIKELGLSSVMLPMVIIVMDFVHAAISFPLGKYADKISKAHLLKLGMLVQLIAAALMAFVNTWQGGFLAVLLVGIYMGMTQGAVRALIASLIPLKMRGTAFAIFYFICGISVLIGNSVAGILSDNFGLYAVFAAGSAFTAVAVIAFSLLEKLSLSPQRSKA